MNTWTDLERLIELDDLDGGHRLVQHVGEQAKDPLWCEEAIKHLLLAGQRGLDPPLATRVCCLIMICEWHRPAAQDAIVDFVKQTVSAIAEVLWGLKAREGWMEPSRQQISFFDGLVSLLLCLLAVTRSPAAKATLEEIARQNPRNQWGIFARQHLERLEGLWNRP